MSEPKTEPVIPCRPDMREEAAREIVIQAAKAVRMLHDLQRAAHELDFEVFAARVAIVEHDMAEAKDELVRSPR